MVNKKISRPGKGQCFSVSSRDTFKRSIHDEKTLKRSKRTGNRPENQEKDGGRISEDFVYGFEIFFALCDPHRLRLNSDKNKNPAFSVLLGLKAWDGFHRGRR